MVKKLNLWLRKIKYENKWIYFRLGSGYDFQIIFNEAGYFDSRPNITISLFFLYFKLRLPFKTKWDDCDPPQWGIKYHNNYFWIHYGGYGNMNGGDRYISFRMPWDWDWIHTKYLLDDNTWYYVTKINVIRDEPENLLTEEYYVGNELCDITYEEREWRLYWFKWLPYKLVRKDVNVTSKLSSWGIENEQGLHTVDVLYYDSLRKDKWN
jgi:hypothetical protein